MSEEYIEFTNQCQITFEEVNEDIEAKCGEKEECSVEETATSNETQLAESKPKKLPTFHIVAYTGEAMTPCSWSDPVVIDLNGIKPLNKLIPIRMNHDNSRGVGHATKVYVKDNVLQADGVISRVTEDAEDVVESAKNGYPWQLSVGGKPIVSEYMDVGTTLKANGKTFQGPLTYVKEFCLCEISFCDLGADHRTSASISAINNVVNGEDIMKDSEPVIDEAGTDVEATVAPQEIEAEQQQEVVVEEVKEEVEAEAEPEQIVVEEKAEVVEEPVKAEIANVDFIKAQERNSNRIAAISSVDCEGFEELRAQAIDEGWTFATFNTALKAARHSRNIVEPSELPKVNKMKVENNSQQIEAALVLETLGENVAKKHYSENELDVADSIRSKLRCFRDVFAYATQSPFYKDDLRDMNVIQAAFTTTSLEKIFRNVVNKSMLAGYETVGDTWRKLCSISRANDFKPIYNYRTGGDFIYKEVDNNDGEISNAKFSEQEFTNSLKTYALKFSLTRAMLYNDDLNALTEMPKALGRGAGETLNDAIFALLLSNPTGSDGNAFFSAAHKNYEVTTSTVDPTLSIASLGRASLLFETQETPDGRPIAQEAKYLLVPSALKIKAWNIMNSIYVNENTNIKDPQGINNPFAGRYEVISTPYLQSSKFTGNSSTDWYLFGDPNRISAIDVVFLNGIEQPTIEQGDVSFDRLGIQYRGVFDFGIALQDFRGAVYMNV